MGDQVEMFTRPRAGDVVAVDGRGPYTVLSVDVLVYVRFNGGRTQGVHPERVRVVVEVAK